MEEPLILRLVGECDKLFNQSLEAFDSGNSPLRIVLEEYRHRFDAWVSYLDMVTKDDISLDARIKNHQATKDLVMRSLDLLRRNLFLATSSQRHDPAKSVDQSMNDGVAEESDVNCPQLEINPILTSIAESITRLNRLAIAIKQSSRATVVARARKYANEHLDLSAYEFTTSLFVDHLYPNAPKTLRRHLSGTMTDRYAMIKYESRCTGNLIGNQLQREDTTVKPKTTAESPESNNRRDSMPTQTNIPSTLRRGTSSFQPSSIDPSKADSDIVKAMVPKLTLHKSEMTYRRVSEYLDEPSPPIFGPNESSVTCQWCSRNIDRSSVKELSCSAKGREHYKQDLQPYVCVNEECAPRPMFASSQLWIEHMRSLHSEDWPLNIYQDSLKMCNLIKQDGSGADQNSEANLHEGNIPYLLSTPREVQRHFYLHHGALSKEAGAWHYFDDNDSPQDHLTSTYRQASVCVLCSCEVTIGPTEESNLKQASGHTQKAKRHQEVPEFSRKRVRFIEPAMDEADDDDGESRILPDSGASQNQDPQNFNSGQRNAMERHIAGHLLFLTVLSTRLNLDSINSDCEDDEIQLTTNTTPSLSSEVKDEDLQLCLDDPTLPDATHWADDIHGTPIETHLTVDNDIPDAPLNSFEQYLDYARGGNPLM